MHHFDTLPQIVRAARTRLSKPLWDYFIGGSEAEITLKRNRLALDSLAFRPQILRDVSRVDLGSTLFGARMRIPVFLAPVGSIKEAHPDGSICAARATARFGAQTWLSSVAGTSMEELRAAAGPEASLVAQVYVRGDDDWLFDYIRRAVDLGYHAFVFTTDAPVYSRRERDRHNRFTPVGRQNLGTVNRQPEMDWALVGKAREKFPDVTMVLKGVFTAEDAVLGIEAGFNAIHVSNHGGRQLDHGQGSIEMLPPIVEAVGGRVPVLVDSGFLRGTDIVKALCLGASAVGLGKLYLWAMAAGGEAGVLRMLELLEEEMSLAMAMLGAKSLAELSPALLTRAQSPVPPGLTAAFPLLEEHPGMRPGEW